jgi:hypothetical protein
MKLARVTELAPWLVFLPVTNIHSKKQKIIKLNGQNFTAVK